MCGIIGSILFDTSVPSTEFGLSAIDHLCEIDHRGQEASGVAYATDTSDHIVHKIILGPPEFLPRDFAKKFPAWAHIAQVKYGTAGRRIDLDERGLVIVDAEPTSKSSIKHAQPMIKNSSRFGDIALVHNGNLTNVKELKAKLEKEEVYLTTDCDTEIILRMICYYLDIKKLNVIESIRATMVCCKGAYSCIVIVEKEKAIFAFRDKKGFRPLEIFKAANRYVVASETKALINDPQATHEKMVNPGEIVHIDGKNVVSYSVPKKANKKHAYCAMEHIYLMSPETVWNGTDVTKVREYLGIELFKQTHSKLFPEEEVKSAFMDSGVDLNEFPLTGLVAPIPESGIVAAQGYFYFQNCIFPGKSYYWEILKKNKRVQRTFIEPNQADREKKARLKYIPHLKAIRNTIFQEMLDKQIYWIILVDDSLIRGTTANYIITAIKNWLKEILPKDKAKLFKFAYLLSSPPYTDRCFMGIDTPTKSELIAANYLSDGILDIQGIRKEIDADLLAYPTLTGIQHAFAMAGENPLNYCFACFFHGKYPIKIPKALLEE